MKLLLTQQATGKYFSYNKQTYKIIMQISQCPDINFLYQHLMEQE